MPSTAIARMTISNGRANVLEQPDSTSPNLSSEPLRGHSPTHTGEPRAGARRSGPDSG